MGQKNMSHGQACARGLKCSGTIDLDVTLCLTTFGGWQSSGLGSKVKNRKIFTSS